MNKRIAIPVEDGMLCEHFGHCEYFYVADLENNEIVKEENLSVTNPILFRITVLCPVYLVRRSLLKIDSKIDLF